MAMILIMVAGLMAGCEGGSAIMRAGGANGLASTTPGYAADNGIEVGARIIWYEDDAVSGDDETIGIGPYVAAAIDPNTLAAFDLPPIEMPFGAIVKLGAFVLWDVEESNPIVGPMLIVDRLITDHIGFGMIHDYQAFGDDLAAAGYDDDYTAMAHLVYRW
jgi:hypothetical protein